MIDEISNVLLEIDKISYNKILWIESLDGDCSMGYEIVLRNNLILDYKCLKRKKLFGYFLISLK